MNPLTIFTRFNDFLFDPKKFFKGVKKEKLVDSIKCAAPVPVVVSLIISSVLAVSLNLLVGVFVFLIIVVGFVVSNYLLHFVFVLFGGKGKLVETFQVALYYYNYLYFLIVFMLLTVFLYVGVASILRFLDLLIFPVIAVNLFVIFKFLMAVLEGFAFFHKTTKLLIFISWFVYNLVTNLIFTLIFNFYFWGSFSGFS